MIRGVLFDFFGTLVEYSPSRRSQGYEKTHGILKARKIAISYSGFLDNWVSAANELDRWSEAQHWEYSMLDVAKRFLLRIHCDPANETLANDIWNSYLNEWNKGVTYIQNTGAFIERLGVSYKLGIVTNTHYAPLIWQHLNEMGIANAFWTVVTSVEHGRPKPHRAIFDYAIHSLGTPPSETLYVGDSYVTDYLGAKSVGMPALLIDPRHESDVPADDRINHVFETENWLASAFSQEHQAVSQ
jgi:putative hydrolase of the HAD superfamily